MSIYAHPTFDFSNATFTHAPTRAQKDRLVVDKVVALTEERIRIASRQDRHDADGRLPGETRVWRTRTGSKIHLGFNHSHCGVRANIEYKIASPTDAQRMADSGVLCEKCFGPNPERTVARLIVEAQRREENGDVHRALCVTLAAARRAYDRDLRTAVVNETPASERIAYRTFRAIYDAIALYWDGHGKTEAERQGEAKAEAERQAERLDGMEVRVVTDSVMKQSRDVEVTGPGSNLRQVVGLTWAEARRLHALLGEALAAHDGPQDPTPDPTRPALDADGMTAEGREALATARAASEARQDRLMAEATAREEGRVRNATDQRKALLSLEARGGDVSALQALADLLNDGHQVILGEVDGFSRRVRCNQPYRVLLGRVDYQGEPGAPLIRVEQWIQRDGGEGGWYATGGSWYLDTLLGDDDGDMTRLALDCGQEWEVRGDLAGLLRLARRICNAAGVEIDWLSYHKQS